MLEIKRGALFQHFEAGLIRFDRWISFDIMVFVTVASGQVIKLPEHKFDELHARRRIRMIEQDAEGNPIEIRAFAHDDPES